MNEPATKAAARKVGADGDEGDRVDESGTTSRRLSGFVKSTGRWIVDHSAGIGLLARTTGICLLLFIYVIPLATLGVITIRTDLFSQPSMLLVEFCNSVAANPLSEAEVVKLLLGFVTAAAALRGQRSTSALEVLSAMTVWGLLSAALLIAFCQHYALEWWFTIGNAADFAEERLRSLTSFTDAMKKDLLMLFGVLLGLRAIPDAKT